MKIKLPVLYMSDEQVKLQEMGMDTDAAEDDVRENIFYSVSSLAVWKGKKEAGYTTIYSGGDHFIVPLPIEEVERLVDHEMRMDVIG